MRHVRLLGFLAKWIVLGAVVGCIAGVSSATFLTLLSRVTEVRGDHPWLLALLPECKALKDLGVTRPHYFASPWRPMAGKKSRRPFVCQNYTTIT